MADAIADGIVEQLPKRFAQAATRSPIEARGAAPTTPGSA